VSREAAVLVTLVAYKLVLVGLGWWARGRTRDGADFFLGGRKLGPVVAALSAAASSSSAWTLLGVSGYAYRFGLAAIWLFPACVGGFVLNWYLLAGPLRRLSHESGALTVTELLAGPPGGRFRRPILGLASAVVVVFLTVYVASQLQGAGKTFNETFGLSVEGSILLGSAVVLAYTLLGGFWAVSITDTLQGLLMAVTALVLPLGALAAVGGLEGLAEGLRAVPQDGFLSPTRGLAGAAAIGFVAGLLGIGLGYPGQPHVVNRFMALRQGAAVLARARRVAIAWAVLVFAGMIVLGLAGRVLFAGLADPEVVFLAATNELFPPVVAGVMVAAVLSAILSTADSQLLVAASAVAHDLGGGGAGREMLHRSRIVVAALAVVAVAAALWGPREIFSPVLVAWSVLGAVFGPPLLITVLRSPPPPARTLAAMSAGLVLTVAGATWKATSGEPWDPVWERVVPFLVSLAIVAMPHAGARRLARSERHEHRR
jgi:sodium/proline symporter